MKNIILLLIFCLLSFKVYTQSYPTNQELTDSIVYESVDGTDTEIVYFKNGDIAVYASFLYIENIYLRELYTTYINLCSDYLKILRTDITGSHFNKGPTADYIMFNNFLYGNEESLISYQDYLNKIYLAKEINTSKLTAAEYGRKIIGVFLALISLITIVVAYFKLIHCKKDTNNAIDDVPFSNSV